MVYKMARRKPRKGCWDLKPKSRCLVEGCNKRAKDDNGLCRIHSPMREGFVNSQGGGK